MKKTGKKKKIILAVILAIAVLLIIGFIIAIVILGKKETASELKTTYEMEIKSGDSDSTIFQYVFDDDGNYSQLIGIGDKQYPLDGGTYIKEGAEVTCKSSGAKQRTEVFKITGDYLVSEDYMYDGIVPDTDTFDAECTHTSDDSDSKVIFSKDGTFEYKSSSSGTTDGTYERDGDIIKLNASDGSSLIDFLICDGQITNAYYIAK